MKNLLNEIKNNVYEAEGLLELLGKREDKLGDLSPLILSRLEKAISIFNSLSCNTSTAETDTLPEAITEPLPSPNPTISINEHKGISLEQKMETPEEMIEKDDVVDETVDMVEDKVDRIAIPDSEKREAKEVSEKPAFCLNDRFRFRRAIFESNDHAFNEAMNEVAGMDNYEEAEEYFYGEKGLDAENEDVQDFMTIIRQYFE